MFKIINAQMGVIRFPMYFQSNFREQNVLKVLLILNNAIFSCNNHVTFNLVIKAKLEYKYIYLSDERRKEN